MRKRGWGVVISFLLLFVGIAFVSASDNCSLSAPLNCISVSAFDSSNVITLTILNGAGQDIIINSISFSECNFTASSVNFPDNLNSGDQDTYLFYCNSDLIAGQTFNSDVIVQYKMEGNDILLTVTGEINTLVADYPTLCEEVYLHYPSEKLYVGDSIDKVRSILTYAELPELLVNDEFVGNVVADYTQTLRIGSRPIMAGPPVFIDLGVMLYENFYKYTLTFDRAVNFTDTNSIGEHLNILGNDFLVVKGTYFNDLYLLRSSKWMNLSIGGNAPSSQDVFVEGKRYTVGLISASGTSATIKVTDEFGISLAKEINEGTSKNIQGLEVVLNSADEDMVHNVLAADLTVGAKKFHLVAGEPVMVDSGDEVIEGTYVTNQNTDWNNTWTSTTSFAIAFFAPESEEDLFVGTTWTDPVFNNLNVVFESYSNQTGAMIKFGGCVNEDSSTFEYNPFYLIYDPQGSYLDAILLGNVQVWLSSKNIPSTITFNGDVTPENLSDTTSVFTYNKDSVIIYPEGNVSYLYAIQAGNIQTYLHEYAQTHSGYRICNDLIGSNSLSSDNLKDALSLCSSWYSFNQTCGDINGEGHVDVLDIIYLIDYLFRNGTAPTSMWAANVNGDTAVNVLDAIYLIDYKYKNGPALNCADINQTLQNKMTSSELTKGMTSSKIASYLSSAQKPQRTSKGLFNRVQGLVKSVGKAIFG